MTDERKRVLFVCIGNSCRSQMAEAFARAYGDDVLIAGSAGLAPAFTVAPDTIRAMAEKNLDVRAHFPKSLRQMERAQFDRVINMSGVPLPEMSSPVVDWEVADPIGLNYGEHCQVRDDIERKTMDLILDLRREKQEPSRLRGQGSGRVEL